ncbi:hypothetical protein WJX74_003906 [Apatococcus lobatus]|uniref:Uncharacterized protein n=1 Tax=Apatococcus lobatus TaxID=904363 RepID=A0AAW1RZT2_9CHLO
MPASLSAPQISLAPQPIHIQHAYMRAHSMSQTASAAAPSQPTTTSQPDQPGLGSESEYGPAEHDPQLPVSSMADLHMPQVLCSHAAAGTDYQAPSLPRHLQQPLQPACSQQAILANQQASSSLQIALQVQQPSWHNGVDANDGPEPLSPEPPSPPAWEENPDVSGKLMEGQAQISMPPAKQAPSTSRALLFTSPSLGHQQDNHAAAGQSKAAFSSHEAIRAQQTQTDTGQESQLEHDEHGQSSGVGHLGGGTALANVDEAAEPNGPPVPPSTSVMHPPAVSSDEPAEEIQSLQVDEDRQSQQQALPVVQGGPFSTLQISLQGGATSTPTVMSLQLGPEGPIAAAGLQNTQGGAPAAGHTDAGPFCARLESQPSRDAAPQQPTDVPQHSHPDEEDDSAAPEARHDTFQQHERVGIPCTSSPALPGAAVEAPQLHKHCADAADSCTQNQSRPLATPSKFMLPASAPNHACAGLNPLRDPIYSPLNASMWRSQVHPIPGPLPQSVWRHQPQASPFLFCHPVLVPSQPPAAHPAHQPCPAGQSLAMAQMPLRIMMSRQQHVAATGSRLQSEAHWRRQSDGCEELGAQRQPAVQKPVDQYQSSETGLLLDSQRTADGRQRSPSRPAQQHADVHPASVCGAVHDVSHPVPKQHQQMSSKPGSGGATCIGHKDSGGAHETLKLAMQLAQHLPRSEIDRLLKHAQHSQTNPSQKSQQQPSDDPSALDPPACGSRLHHAKTRQSRSGTRRQRQNQADGSSAAATCTRSWNPSSAGNEQCALDLLAAASHLADSADESDQDAHPS